MKKLTRLLFAAVFGFGITIGLILFMMALIGSEKKHEETNYFLTTQVKVSSPPGLEPSRKINSDSNKKHHKLPSKRTVNLPFDHKKMISDLMAQEADGTQNDPFASPKKQQKLFKLGSKSQASVKLAGKFTVLGEDPQYPRDALREGQEGWVDTKIFIKANGEVEQVDVLAAGPEGIFEQSVLDAVSQWKLKIDHNDQAIEKSYFHRFEFKISE